MILLIKMFKSCLVIISYKTNKAFNILTLSKNNVNVCSSSSREKKEIKNKKYTSFFSLHS